MEFAARSDRGLVRQINEDHYVIPTVTEVPAVFIVADGLGGHRHGELASELACQVMVEELQAKLPAVNNPARVREILTAAVQNTNNRVYLAAQKNDDLREMGTTLTTGVLYAESMYIAHIGDSRAYLCRHGETEQLTKDHTLVNEMMAQGQITKEQSSTHPKRNWLTQAIGFPEYLDVDLVHLDRLAGDRYLFCSDGLYNAVGEAMLSEMLASDRTPEEVCDALLEASLAAAANDNVTVIVVYV